MKRVLYFFPDDITRQNAGNKARALNLLKYFSDRGFTVDFASVNDDRAINAKDRAISFLKDHDVTANIYLLPRKPGKNNPVFYFLRYKLWDLFYYLFAFPLWSNIPAYLTLKLKNAFKQILRQNSYDYIIISYVHSAGLVSDRSLTGGARLIIDTHDFLTAQFKNKRNFNLGATFADEINRLNTFDEIWAISPEEEYVFNQFCKPLVRYIPMMMDAPPENLKPASDRKYDLIYVGNDNEHNILSIKWFFKEVYPLLPSTLRILMIGKITNHIGDDYPVEKILFAESLIPYYADSKIALCPMLQGTGVKIKVVEALAFALPVVCTSRGVDGLPHTQNNGCLVSDNAGQFAQNIKTLLSDGELYLQQSSQATTLFNNYFESNAVYKLLDKTFNKQPVKAL